MPWVLKIAGKTCCIFLANLATLSTFFTVFPLLFTQNFKPFAKKAHYSRNEMNEEKHHHFAIIRETRDIQVRVIREIREILAPQNIQKIGIGEIRENLNLRKLSHICLDMINFGEFFPFPSQWES